MTRMTRWAVAVFAVVAFVGTGAPAVSAGKTVPHDNVTISTNKDFTAANGVRGGDGSKSNPYVISGWEMRNLTIQNTGKWVTLRDNAITGQLVLDWIGHGLKLHDNVINDMRVNRNRSRTGMPTSGAIVRNKFGVVGQLRHWDGLFAQNVVGRTDNLGAQAVNFDGFNGARFVDNTIYGYVDARLHGHHHSSGWGEPTHNHSTETPADEASVHRYRYHEVTIADNSIRTTHSYALAYLDTNHAGNDRTAPSEQDPNLNKPHVHFTKVHLLRNRLTGAGILVNVFQATNNLHPWFVRGFADIKDNRISLAEDRFFTQLNGIEVDQAQAMTLRVTGNSITGWRAADGDPMSFFEGFDNDAGILLNTIDDADVAIVHNSVANRVNGVRATQMTPTVRWRISDLKTSGVDNRVAYDDTVSNKPQ
jgi:hypothetical protein